MKLLFAVAACALLALAACHRSTDSVAAKTVAQTAATRQPEADVDPAVGDAMKNMAPGVHLGASDAPIDARFNLEAWPVSGAPFKLTVALLPTAAIPTVTVQFTTEPDLQVVDPQAPVSLENLAAGTLRTIEITAQSAEPGTRVVNVTVTAQFPTGPLTRVFAFPVIVAESPRPTT